MLAKIRSQLFLIGLAMAVIIGFLGYRWLDDLASWRALKTAIVLSVMAMMAAPVPLELFAKTVMRPWPGLLASLICLGAAPLLGWLGSVWMQPDLAGGLIVACCVPSTLASAAVLTRKAGGDDTVPIFVTLVTNLGCVLVTPLWLVLMLGSGPHLHIGTLVSELAILVVLPIVSVQIIRRISPAFCNWSKNQKSKLSAACQVGILIMVLLGSAQMGQRWYSTQDVESSRSMGLADVSAVIAVGIVIHLICLVAGWFFARWTKVGVPQAIGVSFAGSQKTLMIGINLAIDYQVSILPMIAYHVSQLIVDAMIAQRWRYQLREVNEPSSKPD